MLCGNASEGPIRAERTGSFRCATNILTTLLAIVTTLHDRSVRLGLCVRHHDLMDDVRQDITTAFTALAGIIHKSVSGQWTETLPAAAKLWAWSQAELVPWPNLDSHQSFVPLAWKENLHMAWGPERHCPPADKHADWICHGSSSRSVCLPAY